MPDCVLLHTMMGSSVTPTAAECLNWSVTEVKSAVPQVCALARRCWEVWREHLSPQTWRALGEEMFF